MTVWRGERIGWNRWRYCGIWGWLTAIGRVSPLGGGVVGRIQLGWVGLVLWLGRRMSGVGVRGAVVLQDGG